MMSVGWIAVVHRGGVEERLERRSRLSTRLGGAIEVALVPVAAADHAANRAGRRVDRDQRGLQVGRALDRARAVADRRHVVGARLLELELGLERHHLLLERTLANLLEIHVERGVDPQPALVERVRSVELVEVLADHLDEVRRAVVVVALRRDAERRVQGAVELDLRDRLGGEHVAQHLGAPRQRGRGAAARRVEAGIGGHAGEQRALGQRQLLQRLAEVRLRGGIHAVGALAEVDLIEVHLEDLILGVVALDLDREHDLLELARQRALVREEQVARQLLGDRAAALRAAHGAARPDRRAPDAPEVDAPVLVEAAILGRERGVDQRARNLPQRNRGAVLLEELVQHAAARVVDHGLDRRLDLRELLGRRQVAAQPLHDAERRRRPRRTPTITTIDRNSFQGNWMAARMAGWFMASGRWLAASESRGPSCSLRRIVKRVVRFGRRGRLLSAATEPWHRPQTRSGSLRPRNVAGS